MQEIMNFLSFKTMISQELLLIFYYMGALVVPLFIYKYTKYFYKPMQQTMPKIFMLFIILFVFMELLWRMLFEFLIAFLQIRDALVVI